MFTEIRFVLSELFVLSVGCKVNTFTHFYLRRSPETHFGVHRFDMGIICVDNRKIQRINHIYRKKNQPTDVLSFPFYEDLKPGKIPCALHRDEYNLGDILAGVEYVTQQCKEMDFCGDAQVVTAHGICHLLGYRHETEEEWNEGTYFIPNKFYCEYWL